MKSTHFRVLNKSLLDIKKMLEYVLFVRRKIGNFIRQKQLWFVKMRLEEVLSHPFRDDIYINQIVTPYEEVKDSDKTVINRILLKEVARRRLELTT